MFRSIIAAGVCLTGALLFAIPSSVQADDAGMEAYPYLSEVRAHFDRAVRDDRVVGLAAAVIENGEPVWLYTHGETAAGSGHTVTEGTVFRAASVSKTFTGTLMALLEDRGLFDLGEDMPEDVLRLQGSRQPTIEEILSHRTGLPPNAYDNILEAGDAPDRIRERLAGVNLICPVGSCYSYQNVAFASVEAFVERATGNRYEDVLQSELFESFDMPSASIGVEALRSGDSWAAPHRGWRRSGNQAGNPRTHYDNTPSAAGVNLSLEDMIHWAQLHLGTRPGLPESVRSRAHAPLTETRRETRRLGDLSSRVSQTWYGLGWRIYQWQDRTLVLHSGYLSGYGAQIVMEPETGFAFVALWNSDNRPAWWLWPVVMDLRTGASDGRQWLSRFDED